MSIDEIIDEIIDREGRVYTNHPADRGGPTKFGVTLKTLREFRGTSVSAQDVRTLSEHEARLVYRSLYIIRPKFNRISDTALRRSVIDFGVNHGVVRAARNLQVVLGVKPDGIVGPITLGAANGRPQVRSLNIEFNKRRLEYMARIVRDDPSQAVFILGWVRRVNKLFE